MHLDIEKATQMGFHWKAALPQSHKGVVLRGSDILSAEGEPGIVILQEVLDPEFSIRSRLFHLSHTDSFIAKQEKSLLVSLLAIRNTIHCFIRGLGALELQPGQFALLHCGQEHTVKLHFEESRTYEHLELSWSEAIIRETLPYLPLLGELFMPGANPRSYYLGVPGRPAGPEALDIAQSILKSPYDAELSKLYFEYRVREYLIPLLVQAGSEKISSLQLTSAERERITELAEKLRSHPEKRFPIVMLSHESGMNEMKLRSGFKEQFGQGIFEFQLALRMNEALRLLRETDLPTKVIASRVGYRLTTSFITKFREYFGYPPGRVRNPN